MAEILEQRCSSLDNSLPFCSLYASKAAVAMKSSSCSVQVRMVVWKGYGTHGRTLKGCDVCS